MAEQIDLSKIIANPFSLQTFLQMLTPQILSGQKSGDDDAVIKLRENYERNKGYSEQNEEYQTRLDAEKERAFLNWVQKNQVPFNPKMSVQDYDMRGFWQALQNKDPRAVSAIDPNDNKIHYPDYWKTPYHETFSNESQWATQNAPSWNESDQLVDKSGKVVFDDKNRSKK